MQPMATTIMAVPRSLPATMSIRLARYPTNNRSYALSNSSGLAPLRTFSRASINSPGIQMHNASLTISAGCTVNTFGMPIQPLLPLTSTPSDVRVMNCSTSAKTRNAPLHLRYAREGIAMAIAATTMPPAQNNPCLSACDHGD